MLSGPSSPGTQYVPGSSFLFLALVIGGIIFAPVGLEVVINRIMQNSPEMYQAKIETDYSSEEYCLEFAKASAIVNSPCATNIAALREMVNSPLDCFLLSP